MPIEKDKDGRPVETKIGPTEIGVSNRTLASSSDGNDQGSGQKTVVAGQTPPPLPGAKRDAFDDRTRIAGAGGPAGRSGSSEQYTLRDGSSPPPTDEVRPGTAATPASLAVGPKRTELVGVQGVSNEVSPNAAASADPVVGWLVIVEGPGRGYSLPVGTGMNSVGRGADQRIRLDFGDNQISSSKHFFVSYDPRSRQFGLHRGDGANLTYLNEAPVYGSEKLENHSLIELGSTKLRFAAFCGEQFSWDA